MLLRGDFLHQEIKARLREARERNARDAADLQTDYDGLRKSGKNGLAANDNDEAFRAFLREVLENIHWNSKLKYLKRKFRLEATRNTLKVALFVLTPVIAVLFILPVVCVRTTLFACSGMLFVPVLTFGLLGALFSRLITLQTRDMTLDELRKAISLRYINLRACIGACGALLVYFFLQSELVSSTVLPKFDEFTNDLSSNSDRKNLALLIVWSFIAGFSEWLVSSVLSNTEQQMGGAVSGRPRPPGS